MSKQIPLTQGKFAIVDDEDYEWLSQWKWSITRGRNSRITFYAKTNIRGSQRGKSLQMHRLILGLTDPKIICDHKNLDTLDNRRENLRVASRSQNGFNSPIPCRNKSGFKGVHFHKATGKWVAQMRIEGEAYHLGLFLSPEEASQAYLAAARDAHGEFFYKPDCIITRLTGGTRD